MLVDVVRMWSAGQRLPSEQLRALAPLRGELQIVMIRSAPTAERIGALADLACAPQVQVIGGFGEWVLGPQSAN